MIKVTTKTDMNLAVALPIDLSEVDKVTEGGVNRYLGNLATLTALRTRLFVVPTKTTGSFRMKLKAGNETITDVLVDGATDIPIDLTQVSSAAPLTVVFKTAVTGNDVNVSAWLEVEHPMYLG